VSPIKESNDNLADVGASAAMAELQEIRDSIDNIDASIIHMLAERFRCTQKVGVLKARHHLPPSDPGRVDKQVTRLRQLASAAKLDPEFAEKFLAFVIREVIRIMKLPGADTLNARLFTCSRPEIRGLSALTNCGMVWSRRVVPSSTTAVCTEDFI